MHAREQLQNCFRLDSLHKHIVCFFSTVFFNVFVTAKHQLKFYQALYTVYQSLTYANRYHYNIAPVQPNASANLLSSSIVLLGYICTRHIHNLQPARSVLFQRSRTFEKIFHLFLQLLVAVLKTPHGHTQRRYSQKYFFFFK